MSFITDPKGAQFGLFKTDTDPSDLTMVGQRFATNDGREVVLAQNGAVALASGVLTQHSAIVANHQNLAVTAFSAANTTTGAAATVTVTTGATAVTLNQYAGGFAVVNAGTGIGQTLRIASNPVNAGSASMVVTLEDAPAVALDTSSKICLIAAPYTGIIISPTTATASSAGVTLYPIPASSYGFIVVRGVTSCLSDASVAAVGLGIASSTTTAGCITVGAATLNRVGIAYQTGVSAEARAVYVNL